MPVKKSNKKKLGTKKKSVKKESFKTYQIHDNGGRPFEVKISKSSVKIYKKKDYKLIKTVNKFLKVWVGIDNNPENDYLPVNWGLGNSILIKLTKLTYMHIGNEIYKFTTKDEIVDYRSPIGNNDVPYPISFGKNNTYFMFEKKYVKNEDFKKHDIDYNPSNANDLYYIYYFPHKYVSKKVKKWYKRKPVDKKVKEDIDLPRYDMIKTSVVHKREL